MFNYDDELLMDIGVNVNDGMYNFFESFDNIFDICSGNFTFDERSWKETNFVIQKKLAKCI